MHDLPRKAQAYLISVYVVGILATIGAVVFPCPPSQAQRWEVLLFGFLAVVGGSKKICLVRRLSDDDAGSMSLGFCITFAAQLRFGPLGGILIGLASGLSACLYPKRQPWHQLAFNVSLVSIEGLGSCLVFLTLNHWSLHLEPIGTFKAVIAASLVYFLINTGAVAIIISLCAGGRPVKLWRETFLWTAPSFFAGACITALALLIVGNHVSTVLLFLSPVAYLTYSSYATYIARVEEKQQHIEELQLSQAHLADLYLATIKSLALAIDAKDQYTHQHILRVQRYAVATAKHMGLTGGDLEGVNTGALLHDIGKLGVPEYVLLKPGRLTDEEFAKIKKHPEIGAAILDPVEFPWPVLPAVMYHHEKWDGTGYPEGLKGENIPLQARILAVADVYDALTSTRSYRNAWTHEKAVAVIKKDAGTHFDPVIVEAFLQVIDGVVEEMAQNGEGPLVIQAPKNKLAKSKADEAALTIQRASSELWALYEVAQTLSSSLGLQETLEILARKLAGILPGTACLFLLKDNEEEMLLVREVVGLNQEFFKCCRTLNTRSVSLQVLRTQETYQGEYDADDMMLNSVQTAEWIPLNSALIVPIAHQGEVLGTINVYHPQEDAFGVHDRQLLETIAERAAMALYNGLLFDRTRSHAHTDPLTGLFNVRYLTQYVEDRCKKSLTHGASHEMANGHLRLISASDGSETETGENELCLRAGDQFALLCLDLDSFKPINDNFGHQKGDQVLRDLGAIFRETVREEDVVARYGGDEFLIVLNGVGQTEAIAMAARLHQAVEDYDPGLVHERLGALRLGVSVGYACFPQDGQDCAALLSAADQQMYHNKTDRKLGQLAGAGKVRDGREPHEDTRETPKAA